MREWESRPICLGFAAVALGLSVLVSWWHLLFLIPLLYFMQKKRSRLILLIGAGVGVLLSPPQTDLILSNSTFDGVVDVISVPMDGKKDRSAIVDSKGVRYVMRLEFNSPVCMGDRIRLKGQLSPILPGSYPTRGVVGVLRPLGRVEVLSSGSPIWKLGMKIRESFVRMVDRSIPDTGAEIANALCFNVTSGLTSEDYDNLQKTGTTHVISTSGMHVVITAAMLLFLMSLVPIPRALQLAIVIVFLLVYAGAAGFRPPIVRAVVMTSVGLVAYLGAKEPDGLSAWAAAGLTNLILDPYTITDVGFILSMAASGSLMLFMGHVEVHEWKWTDWLKGLARASLVVTLICAPLVAYYFGRVSLVGILANLIIEPMVTIVVWGALTAWLLSGILPFLSVGLLSEVVGPTSVGIDRVLAHMASWPMASIDTPTFSAYWLTLFYAAVLMIWRPSVRQA